MVRKEELIDELKKNEARIWKRLAKELEKPRRSRREVNISKIERYTKEGEVIVVPGKVLGSGTLRHKVTIAAFSFSKEASEKIKNAGGKIIDLKQLIKENPKGTGVRIIG
ncbi:MAG: 50S ribosomal protein L18e [Candidatus Parvarchaeota archaeon]|nr:50S ribosomal protein L18e [Candidatus Jingweiarchaeum tengchongense]MCW1298300.1 50S ribosomal protein L18e [Candidatus Jingweiarchaeum tengchongense]MCW1300391.1 50S ribosomal protein L18e [Candidatus Jingweiarchaeum tengchongense]MCW1304764.1 50S ribosomal protein L18e [Candidatus Jingweiarchaeum tengchongense]MCW1305354.1 50S ribosomal protein L18e [Candidatus Jingweiarchaeum tengchongense]